MRCRWCFLGAPCRAAAHTRACAVRVRRSCVVPPRTIASFARASRARESQRTCACGRAVWFAPTTQMETTPLSRGGPGRRRAVELRHHHVQKQHVGREGAAAQHAPGHRVARLHASDFGVAGSQHPCVRPRAMTKLPSTCRMCAIRAMKAQTENCSPNPLLNGRRGRRFHNKFQRGLHRIAYNGLGRVH
jgi:hypothetical protein